MIYCAIWIGTNTVSYTHLVKAPAALRLLLRRYKAAGVVFILLFFIPVCAVERSSCHRKNEKPCARQSGDARSPDSPVRQRDGQTVYSHAQQTRKQQDSSAGF